MSSSNPGGGTVNPYAKTTKKTKKKTAVSTTSDGRPPRPTGAAATMAGMAGGAVKKPPPRPPRPPPNSGSSAAAPATATTAAASMIHNPYAKKRSLPDPSAARTFHANDDGLQTLQPYSFSQAFDTTPHDHNDNNDTSISAQEMAERRAINFHANNNKDVDIRQHHLHLQPHILKVSNRQKGNPVLQFIRNVPFGFVDMIPDYILNGTTCALYLSLKYHRLFPAYLHRRLSELREDFQLRILLVLVDVSDNADLLLQLNKVSATHNLTLVLAWSEAEAGRYLETYKALDGKDATSIQKRESNHIVDQMQDFWTACKPVNKTDAASLWEHFGTLRTVVNANRDEWALVPGLGPVKTQRLFEALHKPFSSRTTRNRKRIKEQQQQQEDDDNRKETKKAKRMLENEDENDEDEEEVEWDDKEEEKKNNEDTVGKNKR